MLCHFTSAHAVSLPQLFPSSQSVPLLSPLIHAVPLIATAYPLKSVRFHSFASLFLSIAHRSLGVTIRAFSDHCFPLPTHRTLCNSLPKPIESIPSQLHAKPQQTHANAILADPKRGIATPCHCVRLLLHCQSGRSISFATHREASPVRAFPLQGVSSTSLSIALLRRCNVFLRRQGLGKPLLSQAIGFRGVPARPQPGWDFSMASRFPASLPAR